MTRRSWKLVLLATGAGVSAAAVALLAPPPSPAAPSAGRASSSSCASWAHVKSFNGLVNSLTFSDRAQGASPGVGGTRTIAFDREASNLQIRLGTQLTGSLPGFGSLTFFNGKTKGGSISAIDTSEFSNGPSLQGAVNAIGLPQFVSATLILWPKGCEYQLQVQYAVKTRYTGSKASQPRSGIWGGAFTPRRPIPASLKLSGVAAIQAYHDGCSTARPPDAHGCFEFGGDWANDFDTLKRCHSVTAVNCAPAAHSEGVAYIRWNLAPTFAH